MAFPTTGLLDNFNRANGAVGANWTRLFTSSGLTITSNAVGNDGATGAGEMYYNPITPGPDTEVFATWATVSGPAFLLWARVSGAIDVPSGYLIEFDNAASSNLIISKITAGTVAQLGAVISLPTRPANGHRFGVDIVGSVITAYQDTGSGFASVGTRTDGTFSGAGRIGMSVVGTADRVDDFSGGTVVTGPPPPAPDLYVIQSNLRW